MLDTLDQIAKVHEAVIFAGLDDGDLEKLSELLDAIARNLLATQTRDDTKK